MDQKPEPLTQLTTNNEEERGGLDEEEFYEKIEAPKFVDFTAPDPYRPDDRYWFCLRVGCDHRSMKKRKTMKQFRKISFFGSWQPEVPTSDFDKY